MIAFWISVPTNKDNGAYLEAQLKEGKFTFNV